MAKEYLSPDVEISELIIEKSFLNGSGDGGTESEDGGEIGLNGAIF